MKKEIYLHIPEPCHENWDQMTPVQQGRFCQSCSKQVVDFSQMSDRQILDMLSKSASKTCGRFSPQQLERPIVNEIPPFLKPHKLFLSAVIPAFLLANADKANAQVKDKLTGNPNIARMILGRVSRIVSEREITGYVKNEKGQPVAGASIVIKGAMTGTVTDEKGKFVLKISDDVKPHLQVSYIGYQTKEVAITKADLPIQVTLSDRDLVLLGDVVVIGKYRTEETDDDDTAPLAVEKTTEHKGVVVNELGAPVPFATVKLNAGKSIVADSSGMFSIEVRKNKKRVTLTASSVGYQSQTSTIALTHENTDPIKISLKNNVALDGVLVQCSLDRTLTGMVGGVSIVRAVTIADTANTFIQKVFNNEMFKAFPNPAAPGSNVTLSFKKAGNYSIQLFDNSGKLYLHKEILNEGTNQTNSFLLPTAITSGIYYLKAINVSTNKQFVDKLIVR